MSLGELSRAVLSRFRNNFIALVTAVLSFANSILYIKAFGVSATSDALYFSSAVIASFSLIPGFLTEQFLQYYNDYKHREETKAASFLAFNLVNVGILGIVLVLAFGAFLGPLLRLMYPRLGAEGLATLASFLRVLRLELFLVGINGLLQGLALSYGRVKAIYLARLLSSSLLLLGQILIIKAFLAPEAYPTLVVLSSLSVGLFLGIVNRHLLAGALRGLKGIDRAFIRGQGPYFKDSVVMRLGHNLQGFFLPLVTSSFWASFPGNLATCYSYASKFYGAIQSVIIGPSQMETQYRISNDVSTGDLGRIPGIIKGYLKVYLPLVVAGSLFTALAIPPVIHVINPGIVGDSVGIIQVSFVFLSLWLLVQCAEGPFVITLVARNQGWAFVLANAINIGIIAGIVRIFPSSIYSILVANILAQGVSLGIYGTLCLRFFRLGLARAERF